MKILQLIFCMILPVVLGCNKEKDSQHEQETLITIESVISETDMDSRIQVFNLLAPEERYDLWYSHLVKARLQFVNASRQDKAALIDSLLIHISINTFDDSLSDSDIFLNYYMPIWLSSAQGLFIRFDFQSHG